MASPQQHAEDWELVAANEVHVIDALKQEGNALFQQQRYFDAIQVYARALAQLPHDSSRLLVADQESLLTLEIAVRLNRALAYIELQDDNLLVYAEQDCSATLAKQPQCVKAFYRRALARERLGKIQEALDDAEKMQSLEPANPAAHALISRLQAALRPQPTATVATLTSDLETHCAVNEATPVRSAADAWNALQEEEQQLRSAFTIPKSAPRAKQSRKAKPSETRKQPAEIAVSTERVLAKTESLWASLAEEEATTVAKIYKKRGPQNTAERLKTASIHPSR